MTHGIGPPERKSRDDSPAAGGISTPFSMFEAAGFTVAQTSRAGPVAPQSYGLDALGSTAPPPAVHFRTRRRDWLPSSWMAAAPV